MFSYVFEPCNQIIDLLVLLNAPISIKPKRGGGKKR